MIDGDTAQKEGFPNEIRTMQYKLFTGMCGERIRLPQISFHIRLESTYYLRMYYLVQ